MAALAIARGLHGAPRLAALAPRLPHALDILAAFAGAVIATLFSYTGQRFFTFADGRGRSG